ncbi:beta strand repeat-containing protein [Desulfosudis oleivorans]|uniref:Ig domain protein group 1 domain protein n=1 Tax=Desulfosudis oleivorans (strain DSM 6200 / JCM 39069 / Hxd3) TaxID=96561 RepID=A8ZSX4_DESOH|nr:Ig-like domain-containing protein [Desulfosudis oleivorans]ABW66138.1 Ig domain protein group 1 domain protein [Desulfosudis oleivorans Hxd3]
MTENKREHAKMRILFSHGIKLCAVLAVLLLVAAGCSSSGGETGTTPVVPTGSDPAAVALSATPGTISAGGTATITARVTDEDSAIVVGATVVFSAESLYGTITATADTDASGVATATFTSSGQTGTTTIAASVGSSVTGSTTLTITPVAAYLSLSTSQTSILTDGVDAADITATVLNASRVPIEGIAVNFSVAAGQLSVANVMTDGSGQAETSLTSGTYDKTNQVVTVTVTAQDLIATIPIQVTGTTVSLSIDETVLASGGTQSTPLTVTVKDGGGTEISGAEVTLTQSGSGTVTLTPASGTTATNGTLAITVTGQNAGSVTITATALGASASQAVTVSGTPFEITSPAASSVSQETGTALPITVRSPDNHDVKFVTTMGTWDINNQVSATLAAGTGTVTSTLNVGINAGIATVRVEDNTDSSISDTLQVAIYAPSDEATRLTLQVSPSTIAPSSGGVTNNTTIKATVKNGDGQVVGDAPVIFTLFRTTGGGEYISPPIVYTSSNPESGVPIGVATTDFYSGSLVSNTQGVLCLGRIDGAAIAGPAKVFDFDLATGTITRSDTGGSFIADGFKEGDTIRVSGSEENDDTYTITTGGLAAGSLTVDDSLKADESPGNPVVIATAEDTDVVSVVISGEGSSVAIGGATVIEEVENNPAAYKYPMSVLVNDSGGNAVPGVTVTLSLWPTKYATGYTDPDAGPIITGEFWNEDLNRSDSLDIGEDTDGNTWGGVFPPRYFGVLGEGAYDTALNGIIDPAKSCAGAVPVTVVTDENGLAQFDHVYLKNNAAWVKVEYRATALVYGSETVSTLNMWLPFIEDEKANLPNSPWGPYP